MMQKGLFRTFYPDQCLNSTYDINFERLYRDGYRGLIFDIDNTLVPHGAPADQEAVALFERLHRLGFSCCLLSNNRLCRVKTFAATVGTIYIENAHKPLVKNYLAACERMGTKREQTVFVGDQLLTDICGAKRSGIRSILVNPIHPKEEFQIVFKRKLERIILYFYKKHHSADQ